MGRLIVNADDMGASSAINDGILQAHLHGIVTATSIMAGGGAYQEAVRLCRRHPTLDCGAHLTLVDGAPVAQAETVPSLVTGRGRFYPDAMTFIRRYLCRAIRAADIARELGAQLARLVDDGLRPTHIDSHQHLHMLPGVHRIVRGLAKRFAIRWIRTPGERGGYRTPPVDWSRVAQQRVLQGLVWLQPTRATAGCRHFRGFYHGGRMTQATLQQTLYRLPDDGVTELMCHPGSAPTRELGGVIYQRDQELAALTSPAVRALISQRRIDLIGFRDLAG